MLINSYHAEKTPAKYRSWASNIMDSKAMAMIA